MHKKKKKSIETKRESLQTNPSENHNKMYSYFVAKPKTAKKKKIEQKKM